MNKSCFIGFVLLVSSFVSCSYELEEIEAPENLIPADTMELVLREMMFVEAIVKTKYGNVGQFHETMKKSGKHVLSAFNIDSLRFDQSMDYYVRQQEELLEIYEAIQDTINLIGADQDTLIQP